MKFVRLILILTLYTGTCVLLWWLAINNLPINVVFYSAMLVAGVAVVITGMLAWILGLMRPFTGFERVQMLLICALCGYALSISVPTVIDRSLSFYILEKLQQRGGGIQQDKFKQIFTTEYIEEHRLMDIRLTEQLESGTITSDGKCVRLTEKGGRLADFSRFFRRNFLPKHRLLMGEYTDRLVDPFAHNTVHPDYLCK